MYDGVACVRTRSDYPFCEHVCPRCHRPPTSSSTACGCCTVGCCVVGCVQACLPRRAKVWTVVPWTVHPCTCTSACHYVGADPCPPRWCRRCGLRCPPLPVQPSWAPAAPWPWVCVAPQAPCSWPCCGGTCVWRWWGRTLGSDRPLWTRSPPRPWPPVSAERSLWHPLGAGRVHVCCLREGLCVTLCTLEVQAVCNVCCLWEGLCTHVCHFVHARGAGRVQCVLFAGGPMLPCVSLVAPSRCRPCAMCAVCGRAYAPMCVTCVRSRCRPCAMCAVCGRACAPSCVTLRLLVRMDVCVCGTGHVRCSRWLYWLLGACDWVGA